MIAETVNPGRCDRCGRHRDRLHKDSLGWICAACFCGNPDNMLGKPVVSQPKTPGSDVEWKRPGGAGNTVHPGLTTNKEWLA